MKQRYIDDGPPTRGVSREEMLSAALPFELHTRNWWRDQDGVVHRDPVVVRFATEAARADWRRL